MTDDQQLIAEARAEAEGVREDVKGDKYTAGLIDRLADALSAAAVRYRAEGIERAAEVAGSSTLPLRRGWDLNTGSRSQWYANGVRDAAARVSALLDENNETTTMNPRKDGQ